MARFCSWAEENQRKALLTVLGLLIGVTLFSATMVVAVAHIRQSEYVELIHPTIKSNKIKSFDYGSEDQEIKSANAISVMFAPPYGQELNHVLNTLNGEKKEELKPDFLLLSFSV